jgi:hypothetical protein
MTPDFQFVNVYFQCSLINGRSVQARAFSRINTGLTLSWQQEFLNENSVHTLKKACHNYKNGLVNPVKK